ncbi:MAG: alpha/beta fold hydrolase [Candidatus Levybacteria bacterium]|nr:alpha/beta fold hydrolase [Candidatus Levybacteria bacterium]
MDRRLLIGLCIVLLGIVIYSNTWKQRNSSVFDNRANNQGFDQGEAVLLDKETEHPLLISEGRKKEYSGSDLMIEETLSSGTNYSRHIASYKSDGLKIYGLLTVPIGNKPKDGWPVIIFNHGYIPPSEYRSTERYVAYVDGFARNGYMVFKPDYRGHGNSEGSPSGAYGSPDYTTDVLSAVASLKKYKDANSNRIGMWGHSLGGFLTLRSMVISRDVKAGVIWAGVVVSYPDLINRWRRGTPPPSLPTGARRWRQVLIDTYGTPEKNPKFWNAISANSFLSDISGPLQLHHGTADTSVPWEFSEVLSKQMKMASREVEYYVYNGDDHNISNNFSLAMQRSVAFFDKYLKVNLAN